MRPWWVSGLQWLTAVCLGIATVIVVADAQRVWLQPLLVLGLIAVTVLLVAAWYGEQTIVRHFRALIETTKRWAAGDFSVRSHLARRGGEVGQLGRAFNELVDALEQHLLEHKQAEREARQRTVELEQAYRDLQQTQAQLIQSEKLAAIGQLASGIAHEVKNPLAVILQSAEFLKRSLAPSSPETGEVLHAVEDAVARADTIVRGLLTLARPASLALAPGNLHDLIAASLRVCEPLLASKKIAVVKDLVDRPPPVFLDPTQMQQALINLFTNAQQAMPEGGRLTIRTARRQMTAVQDWVGRRATDRLKLGEEVLVCEVHDTGGGIPPDKLDRIFEPFFTTKSSGEGTGLGLWIVRAIIEAHRGLIEVESQEGRGTTVRILLPCAQPTTP